MKRYHLLYLMILGLMLLSTPIAAQEFTFVFYNVENLFDVKDDPETNDEEFTPEGSKAWTYSRYQTKIDHIARVLVGIGQWELPAIVGLCEIENRDVLYELTGHRLLKEGDYGIIHKDSPDRRGIDVGIIYNINRFTPLHKDWVQIVFSHDTSLKTRDILYVKGVVNELDTLHIFINHWPSRWGGVEASMPKRVEVARKLKHITDSIFKTDYKANILITGDFNDTPEDSSIYNVLGAGKANEANTRALINLMQDYHDDVGKGTLKYRENWEVYDQIIISEGLFELPYSGLVLDGPYIYAADYLIMEDERYMGVKPYRTYLGPQYTGGFSDHLPVYVRFKSKD